MHFDVDVLRSKGANKLCEHSTSLVHTASLKRGGKRAFVATGHADQTLRVILNLAKWGNAVALASLRELVAGDEQGQILVAGLRFAKQ